VDPGLDIGQTLLVYTAQPDSPSQQALNELASWSASPIETARHQVHQEDA